APDGISAIDMGYDLWNSQIRYLGVGGMLVGGVSALLSLRSSIGKAVGEGFAAMREGATKMAALERTERDTPMKWVILGIVVMIVPIFFIYLAEIGLSGVTLTMTLIMVLAGFIFSAVAGYMAGLVGSS